MDLTNPSTLSQLLKKHHLYTQKTFGQNFLINPTVVEDSLLAADIQSEDTVVEIGVGAGTLTRALAAKARSVISFEIDYSLQPLLKETLADFDNIDLHFQDFRHVDLNQILGQRTTDNGQRGNYKVVANLPYNAGTHILGQLIQLPDSPRSITVLLQKEVAEKITAQAPHATYLSNFIQAYGDAHIVRTVNPGSFLPAPKVHSAILHITRHPSPATRHLAAFSRFLHKGFANPRKKVNKAFLTDQLQAANIDPNLRPENLTFDQWLELFSQLSEKGK